MRFAAQMIRMQKVILKRPDYLSSLMKSLALIKLPCHGKYEVNQNSHTI